MSFNYCSFRAGVHSASGSIGQGELSTSSPILSEIVAAWRLEGSVGRGVAWGKFSSRSSLAKRKGGTASSGHLPNLELEVFGIHCSPKETLWSIKKQFLTAGDHYAEHSVGHATAAILPEDGNVFGTAFGAFVPLTLSPSLLLPLAFQIAARKTCKWKRRGPPWAQATLRAGVRIFLWINSPATPPGPEGSLRCWELCTCPQQETLSATSVSRCKQRGQV